MDLVRHDKSTPFETKSRYYRATEIVVPNLIQPAKLNTNVVLLPCLILELVRQGSSATFGTGLGIIYSALLLFFSFFNQICGPFYSPRTFFASPVSHLFNTSAQGEV